MEPSEATFIVWLCPKGLAALYPFKVNSQRRLRSKCNMPFEKKGVYIRYNRAKIDKWIIEHDVV